MKNLIRITSVIIGLGFIMSTMSGCIFSYMSYKASEKEILKERILATGNDEAIRNMSMGINEKKIIEAVALSNNGIGLKINLVPGWTEILTRNGLRQAGSAVLDAGLIYALAELAKSGGDNTHNSTTNDYGDDITITGDDNVVINGDNNDSNGDDEGIDGDNNDSNQDQDK